MNVGIQTGLTTSKTTTYAIHHAVNRFTSVALDPRNQVPMGGDIVRNKTVYNRAVTWS